MRAFLLVALMISIVVLAVFGNRTTIGWTTVVFYSVTATYLISRNRNAEPMRVRLIDILSEAARA